MFAAKDRDGQLVYAKLINDIHGKYLCVSCGKPVQLIQTKAKHKYFKHIKKHKFMSNETQIHKKSKMMLKQDFEKMNYSTRIETYTDDNQRIDLLATKKNKKIAVEFQRSPISASSLTKRISGYENEGYQNLWFLGMNYFSEKLTGRQLKFLNYNQKWHWYLLFCDEKKKLYLLMYEIQFQGIINHQRYKTKYFLNLYDMKKFNPNSVNFFIERSNKYSDDFKKYCYLNKVNYQKLEQYKLSFAPIMKENLIWTLLQYRKYRDASQLVTIPAGIQIKPQLVEATIAEVQFKLDRLLILIE